MNCGVMTTVSDREKILGHLWGVIWSWFCNWWFYWACWQCVNNHCSTTDCQLISQSPNQAFWTGQHVMLAGSSEHQPAPSARWGEQKSSRRTRKGGESWTRARHKTAWRESSVYRLGIQGVSHNDNTICIFCSDSPPSCLYHWLWVSSSQIIYSEWINL